MGTISKKRRRALIADLIAAQGDLMSLGEKHALEPDEMAAWVSDPDNQRTLSGLCVLADLQTQILLSRYRLLAASRLIKLATEDDPEHSPDVARRACVDLLKLELKRADLEGLGLSQPVGDGSASLVNAADTDALRQMLYGQSDAASDHPKQEMDRRTPKQKGGA